MFNYHTHTYRCRHAVGDVRHYAARASALGMEALGMSDHVPFRDHRWPGSRMSHRSLGGYFRAIDRAQRLFPDLRIFRGLECEYDPALDDYYRELKETWQLDYLIGSVHWVHHEGQWLSMRQARTAAHLASHARNLIQTMESGHFLFIAHPDNFGTWYRTWDENTRACSRDILEAAAALGIPLEINGYGFRKARIQTSQGDRVPYPWKPFWEMAAGTGVRVLFNSDAHRPGDVYASADLGRALMEECGLSEYDPLGDRYERKPN